MQPGGGSRWGSRPEGAGCGATARPHLCLSAFLRLDPERKRSGDLILQFFCPCNLVPAQAPLAQASPQAGCVQPQRALLVQGGEGT